MKKEESCCVIDDRKSSRKDYWDKNFSVLDTPNWVETEQPWIMPWVKSLELPHDANIFCAGVGDSSLIEALLEQGFQNIIANDISEVALSKLKARLPDSKITFLQDDLVNPTTIHEFDGNIDLYIDRATLHFFTKCPEKDHYFQQMYRLLKLGGYSILGVFNKDNHPKCCGLDLQLWSMESLQNRMPQYDHQGAEELPFIELNGSIRNYIYLKSQKQR